MIGALLPALLAGASLSAAAHAGPLTPVPRRDAALERALEGAVAGFHGRVGVYALRLSDGREAAVRADDLFPTASLVKVPILLTLFDAVSSGTIDYQAPLVYSSSRAYADGSVLASFKDGEKVSLPELAWLTASYSDNTAALWLQELAGGGTAVNAWLAAHGFSKTRVNSRTPGREAEHQRFGWGQTTPREMAGLMAGLRQGRLLPPAASQALYRVFSAPYWTDEALSQIPPWVQAASKQGAVDQSRSEVLVVSAPSGPYVLAVITADQQDSSWRFDNEGYALLRKVSALVWRAFEPRSKWSPPDGWERFHRPE